MAYMDGSAFDGSDALLARAEWAAVLVDRHGHVACAWLIRALGL